MFYIDKPSQKVRLTFLKYDIRIFINSPEV